MKILKERDILVLDIEYNTNTHKDKDTAIEYLDTRFGKTGYTIARWGAHPTTLGKGVIIVYTEK